MKSREDQQSSFNLSYLANDADEFGSDSIALDRFRAAFPFTLNLSQSSLVTILIGLICLGHKALTTHAIIFISCQIGVNTFGHFSIQLFQCVRWREGISASWLLGNFRRLSRFVGL